ncbi:MAG: alkaline phosphatase family protein, partial [Planctomycetota bacterium]
ADEAGAHVIVVSEYGITEVSRAVAPNIALRKAGLMHARSTPNGDVLDPFGSRAFALSDHQIAHVYCQDEGAEREARRVLESLDGVAEVLDRDGQRVAGIAHANAGDLVALSEADAWFSYYYWEGPAAEPDFARTVDIHRKPGYDPLEMFLDPALKLPMVRVARRVAQKKLGFRYLMDVIPTDASLVRGSHGLVPADPCDGPIWLSSLPFGSDSEPHAEASTESTPAPGDDGIVAMTSVKGRVLGALGLPLDRPLA